MTSERGVLPFQWLSHAVREGWIQAPERPLEERQFQAASLDLRLGHVAYRMRSSFLPAQETVQKKLDVLTMYDIPLTPSAILERGHVYLIPLLETLQLPSHVYGKANPKSSTGRLDIFTRVITDAQPRFDDIRPGYHGQLYLEVFSRSFTIKVHYGISLNQLRLFIGESTVDDTTLRHLYQETPLLYDDQNQPIPLAGIHIDNGLFIGIDTGGGGRMLLLGIKQKKTVILSICLKPASTIQPPSGSHCIASPTVP